MNEFPEAKHSLKLMPSLFIICDSLSRQNQYSLKFLHRLALLINWGISVYPKPEPTGLALFSEEGDLKCLTGMRELTSQLCSLKAGSHNQIPVKIICPLCKKLWFLYSWEVTSEESLNFHPPTAPPKPIVIKFWGPWKSNTCPCENIEAGKASSMKSWSKNGVVKGGRRGAVRSLLTFLSPPTPPFARAQPHVSPPRALSPHPGSGGQI